MSNASPGSQILMARQPIFDRRQRVVAYELLYRSDNDSEQAVFGSGNSATLDVLLNAYTSICEQGESKRVPAFINLTYDLVVNGTIPDLPKKQVVLELLEDAEINNDFIEGVTSLLSQGYRVALDDFEYSPAYIPLLKQVQIVKVDVLAHDSAQLRQLVHTLAPYRVTLLAEKIETHEKLAECIELGFKLFQGHFLSRPKLIKGRKISTGQVALLQLLQALQSPDVKPEALEKLIIQDPVLTYKLLRIVNSTAYSLVRKVESITEAIVLLGITQVKKWATLIAMTTGTNKPDELTRTLLIRGRMCEQVALADYQHNSGSYFMAGMMSGLHALLDIPQDQMLREVPLSDEVKQAIQHGQGKLGQVLNDAINYEAGNWERLSPDFAAEHYESAYREALEWSHDAMQSMAQSE